MSQHIGAYGRGCGSDMSQGLRACGRRWGHVTRPIAIGQGDSWEYVAEIGTCCMV